MRVRPTEHETDVAIYAAQKIGFEFEDQAHLQVFPVRVGTATRIQLKRASSWEFPAVSKYPPL